MTDLATQIADLQNILDSLRPPPVFAEEEREDIMEVAVMLVDDLISSDPMIYADPGFSETIHDEVSSLLLQQLIHLFDYDIEDEIDEIVKDAISVYHTLFAPKRSYTRSFIRTSPNAKKLSAKINYLQSVPQPDQRTPEWYIFRHKFLTASSIWKAFGSPGSRNQLIYDKCAPLDIDRYKNFSTESPMHWGHKYEPVSIMWYESKYQTNISDFGCIPHPTLEYLAASPDGINTHPDASRYGRMLEVKNIVNRDINGIPKMEYWIQMQIQMEVCSLNECDFLETRFIEYESKEEFLADGTFTASKDNKMKGVMMYFIKEGQPFYEYSPLGTTSSDFAKWESRIMGKHQGLTWMQNVYWRLEEISCILVLRNKIWFETAKPILTKFWSVIQKEKKAGYGHRAPKRKNKMKPSPTLAPAKCYIDVNALASLDAAAGQNEVIPKTPSPIADAVITVSTECFVDTIQSEQDDSPTS